MMEQNLASKQALILMFKIKDGYELDDIEIEDLNQWLGSWANQIVQHNEGFRPLLTISQKYVNENKKR